MHQIYLVQKPKIQASDRFTDLQVINEDDDLEIPAFLRRQKN